MADAVTGAGKRPPGRLFVLSTPEELAKAAAGRLWGIARERAMALERSGTGNKRISIGLSGGRTPGLTLEVLSSEPYRSRFPWGLVHFFQVDERWVPPGDPASNQRMQRESLVSRAPVPPDHFHPVDTSCSDPKEAGRRYEEALRRFFRMKSAGFPRFDAILLGLGADGHTASLFPGSPALDETTAWVTTAEGGAPPVPRVTLTLPVLNAASHVVFLVSGKEKAMVLREVLSGRAGRLPAFRVSPRRGKITFLADAGAAGRTGGTSRTFPGKGDGRGREGGPA